MFKSVLRNRYQAGMLECERLEGSANAAVMLRNSMSFSVNVAAIQETFCLRHRYSSIISRHRFIFSIREPADQSCFLADEVYPCLERRPCPMSMRGREVLPGGGVDIAVNSIRCGLCTQRSDGAGLVFFFLPPARTVRALS